VQLPKRPGEPDSTNADTRRVTELLGWRPEVSFEQGVAKVLADIEYWRAAPVWDEQSIAKATKTWFDQLVEAPT